MNGDIVKDKNLILYMKTHIESFLNGKLFFDIIIVIIISWSICFSHDRSPAYDKCLHYDYNHALFLLQAELSCVTATHFTCTKHWYIHIQTFSHEAHLPVFEPPVPNTAEQSKQSQF